MVSVKEFRKQFEERQKTRTKYGDCAQCQKPVTRETEGPGEEIRFVTVDGVRRPLHGDCYYDALGAEIERHPVAKPRR